MDMQYRRLGRSGLQVSVLSFGSWVTFGPQLDEGLGAECLTAAHEAGVNFYDNAEGYEAGKSETIMGKAIARNGWPRHSYVLSTKLFWGIHNEPNMKNTLNRKYLMQAIDGSLERFGLDFVDLVFCHRADPATPMEGTVWALPGYEWLQGTLTDPDRNEKVRNLKKVADELGCSLAQMSIAWCTK